MAKVLVIGEALIDIVHRPDGTVSQYPGGSPANVALTLGRLGRKTSLLTHIGSDLYAQQITRWLTSDHVALVPGSDSATQTSIAVARLAADGSAEYEFDFAWRLPTNLSFSAEVTCVHIGSLAATTLPGCDTALNFVRKLKDQATITYDPNVRPAVMKNPHDVRGRIEEFVTLADVVKVSDEDLRWLYPAARPDVMARTWQRMGPAVVIVTQGERGALAVNMHESVRVPALDVKVVDTVGAGDSFMGATINALWGRDLLGKSRRTALRHISGDTLQKVLEYGSRVSAVTVSRAGANPPTSKELEALYEQ